MGAQKQASPGVALAGRRLVHKMGAACHSQSRSPRLRPTRTRVSFEKGKTCCGERGLLLSVGRCLIQDGTIFLKSCVETALGLTKKRLQDIWKSFTVQQSSLCFTVAKSQGRFLIHLASLTRGGNTAGLVSALANLFSAKLRGRIAKAKSNPRLPSQRLTQKLRLFSANCRSYVGLG